jgi:DNA ligase D-like protein (predicted 3'-phosphoesterase)
MAADPHFVIQHHLATADHYDFRLEIDGVLVSWAVPKGPTLDPRERRLAKRVDDHSMDYELYEGVLSVQRRGGGTVLVWDRGTYRNVSKEKGRDITAGEALERGHLSLVLAGEKLQGGFSLVRTGDSDQWLLIKKRDETADARRNLTSTQPESVLTGRTLDEIFEQESGA